MAKKRGRPSDFSQDIADIICERIAGGKSLRKVCDEDDVLPHMSTVMRWLSKVEHTEFCEQYADAREVQGEVRADEIVDIADEVQGSSNDAVQAARLRVDTRKWIASKLLPKKYGDKLQHTGEGGGPVSFVMNLRPDEDDG